MLVLRKAGKNLDLNGVWVATSKEHHQSLQNDALGLTDFILDNGDKHDSGWRLIREDHEDFESAVIRICELISHGDQRIGRITKGAAEL